MDCSNMFPICIKNLNYSYGNNQILKNINLKFHKNKFYSIIGPNGSGKTTLLKNILKVLPCKKGSIYIYGEDILKFKNKDLAKKLSSVPQNTNIDFDFSALDVVTMGRNPYIDRFKNESPNDLTLVKKAMEVTNTLKFKEKNINSLSGGERQRVIIARAIAQDTPIILLDEPISSLDIQNQIDVLDTMKLLNKNVTVIAVLHDLNLAAEYSDFLILLKKGEVFCSGSPKMVLTKENIQKVYNIDSYITKNPITNKPYIIPISKINKNKSMEK